MSSGSLVSVDLCLAILDLHKQVVVAIGGMHYVALHCVAPLGLGLPNCLPSISCLLGVVALHRGLLIALASTKNQAAQTAVNHYPHATEAVSP